ncbi:uncharacterized protein [Rutidosis leptorrhynchoides]|uniref:uncharacterized protein n=1 Tax=Rutidosis leptorrhynchoides TaxID=125765 RepID=UPI003A98E082
MSGDDVVSRGHLAYKNQVRKNTFYFCRSSSLEDVLFAGHDPFKPYYMAIEDNNDRPINNRLNPQVDYVSKWSEGKALPTNDARVVVKFLKSLFATFGVPKALISYRDTHFANSLMENVLEKYGITHRFSIPYHP